MLNGTGKILLGPSTFSAENKRPLDRLKEAGFVTIENPYKRKLTKSELQNLLAPDVLGLIAGLEVLDREVLTHSSLKVISRCGVGVSNIDLEAARELGIFVFNTPYGPTRAVAELTLGCLLVLIRQVPQMNKALHDRMWDKRIGRQLKGMFALLIGYGRIGRAVGDLLKGLGVTVLVCDPAYGSEEGGPKKVFLQEALPHVDIVSLHCEGEEQLLGSGEFELMKEGIYVLNAARGGLLDEGALCRALDSGRVAGAWLDTYTQEPYEGPLAHYQQVLLTPHVGSYTREGRLQMELDAVGNLIQGFKNLKS